MIFFHLLLQYVYRHWLSYVTVIRQVFEKNEWNSHHQFHLVANNVVCMCRSIIIWLVNLMRSDRLSESTGKSEWGEWKRAQYIQIPVHGSRFHLCQSTQHPNRIDEFNCCVRINKQHPIPIISIRMDVKRVRARTTTNIIDAPISIDYASYKMMVNYTATCSTFASQPIRNNNNLIKYIIGECERVWAQRNVICVPPIESKLA